MLATVANQAFGSEEEIHARAEEAEGEMGALPLVPLCRPDCAGPSPDRFPTGPGDEDVQPADPRWAALDDLSFE